MVGVPHPEALEGRGGITWFDKLTMRNHFPSPRPERVEGKGGTSCSRLREARFSGRR